MLYHHERSQSLIEGGVGMSSRDRISVNPIPNWLHVARKSKYRYPVVAHLRIIELLEAILEKMEDD